MVVVGLVVVGLLAVVEGVAGAAEGIASVAGADVTGSSTSRRSTHRSTQSPPLSDKHSKYDYRQS